MRQETETRSPQQKICGYEYTVKRGDSFYLIAQRLGVPLRDLLDANSEVNPARLMVGDVLCIPMEEDDAVTTPAQEPAAEPTPAPAVVTLPGEETAQHPEQTDADGASAQSGAGIDMMMAAGSVAELVISAMPEEPAAQEQSAAGVQIAADATADSDKKAPVCTIAPGDCCHTVADGETAEDILQAADISLKTLAAANPGVDLDALDAGTMLCVPGENQPCGNARFYRVEEGGNLEALALMLDVSVAALLRANPCLAPSDFKGGTVISLP